MADIESVQVGVNGSGSYWTIADVTARENIRNLDKITITPLQDHPHLATNDTINQAFSKTEAWFDSLGQMAFKDNLTKSDVTSALNYDPEAEDNEIKKNFQDSVDTICEHIEDKGSPVATPHSLQNVCNAIDAITTGGNYGTLEVNADGDYYPSGGIDAWNYVKVSKDVGQPHTVVFYDRDGTTILKTERNVPYHGYAECTALDGTFYQGQYFKGQNPMPTDVITDLQCYPRYGEYIIDGGETLDSQETICADGGAHYPLGTKKALILTQIGGDFTTYDGLTRNAVVSTNFQMVKVAEGESGSSSTQLSNGLVYYNSGNFQNNGYGPSFEADQEFRSSNNGQNPPCPGQRTSDQRAFLNQQFLANLPPILNSSIKTVTKYSRDYVTDADGADVNNDMETFDKIQVPSDREFKTAIENAGEEYFYTPAHQGIDYTSVFVPTYTEYPRIWTRDMGSRNQQGDLPRRENGCRNTANESAPWGYTPKNVGYSADAGIVIGFCL